MIFETNHFLYNNLKQVLKQKNCSPSLVANCNLPDSFSDNSTIPPLALAVFSPDSSGKCRSDPEYWPSPWKQDCCVVFCVVLCYCILLKSQTMSRVYTDWLYNYWGLVRRRWGVRWLGLSQQMSVVLQTARPAEDWGGPDQPQHHRERAPPGEPGPGPGLNKQILQWFLAGFHSEMRNIIFDFNDIYSIDLNCQ